jgi:hypothetical protein
MMGVKSSLSLYSLFKSQYSADTFQLDLSAAYSTIALSFKTSGGFKYESETSSESYYSTSSLVLVGGDPTQKTMEAWQSMSSIESFPQFIDFNVEAPSSGLTPMYQLFPVDHPRREKLQNALDDYLHPPLHLRIFAAASSLQEYPEASVDINRDLPEKLKHYKVLSGGARVNFQTAGELLVASFPVGDNQWQAKAKDCQDIDSGILTVFAVAVYDPYDWLDVKVLSSPESEPSERPTASIDLDTAYALTGGGAETIRSEPQGSYLTASYPFSSSDPRSTTFPSNTWKVAARITSMLNQRPSRHTRSG